MCLWGSCKFRSANHTTKEFPLPLNLKAVFWDSRIQYPTMGLVILDDMNFVIVGKNDYFLVNGDSVEVEKITKLDVGDNKLLIEVLDTRGNFFYIECIKKLDGTNHDISLITFDDIDIKNEDSFNWIEAVEIEKLLQ